VNQDLIDRIRNSFGLYSSQYPRYTEESPLIDNSYENPIENISGFGTGGSGNNNQNNSAFEILPQINSNN
jgi:hypothetical protein